MVTTERSATELKFIDQYTRSLLVELANKCVRDGSLRGEEYTEEFIHFNPYLEHALNKGWITKKLPRKLTSAGFEVAASFLKR
jgi:hypothetical protein